MKQAIIIGAGPAGLTAGIELLIQCPDVQVTILEETQAIGGISQTVRYHENRMDIGGHRFFSKDERVNAWWQERFPLQGQPAIDDKLLGRQKGLAPGGPDPEKEDQVMLLRERVSRIYYKHHFFDYPVTMNMNTLRNMGFATTMKAGFSYLKALIVKRPENSLEDFYINRFGRVLYSMFFEGYTEKLWGRHPSEIAADWGAQRVKGLSILGIIKNMLHIGQKKGEVETSLIEQFYYPKFGPGQLWETAAQEFQKRGGVIVKGSSVTRLNVENNRIASVTASEKNGEKTYPCDYCLSTMPVRELIAGLQSTTVPANVAEAARTLPYRDFVTVGLLVDKLLLTNQTNKKTLGNIVPDCWIYVQDTGVKLGRIQIFNNWSPYMVADPEHTLWIGLEYFCTEGDDFWTLSEEKTTELAISELKKIGVLGDEPVRDSHVERIRKAYPAYFDGYDHMSDVTAYLNGFENLYCLGRNGQHRYNNMDHSMVTAFVAVDLIKSGATDKTPLWHVNTEKVYHETKGADNQ